MDRTHAEEGFLGHRETGFDLEPPEDKAEADDGKEAGEERRRRKLNSGKE